MPLASLAAEPADEALVTTAAAAAGIFNSFRWARSGVHKTRITVSETQIYKY
jgi:hypothetical protein